MTSNASSADASYLDAGKIDASSQWVRGGVVAALVAAFLAMIAMVAGPSLPTRSGPPIEKLAVEKTFFKPGEISLALRNTGPDDVAIAQVAVNDTYVNFIGADHPIARLDSAFLTLYYPWIEGQPYRISMLTSTGVAIEHTIPVAVESPVPNAGFFGTMALLGLYVGVLPVLLGMLFLPVLRRAGPSAIRFVMALTVGLLAFLAFDGTIEGIEVAGPSGAVFGGPALVVFSAALSYIALQLVSFAVRRWRGAAATRSGIGLSVMIALGIGLHNLGEGLAIGSAYAVGELALGAALVLGFALHNTTEGLAVVAPVGRERVSVLVLLGLGLLAGAPAVVGAIAGAAIATPAASAALLGVGVGAIVQVIVTVAPAVRAPGRGLDGLSMAGLAAGIVVMFATGLVVPA
ncbi:MAG: ZIP family metal transporter [Nocardiaceae bacterium]|nr:ZIP family metal transporter [Nocardiaceae bacterium]